MPASQFRIWAASRLSQDFCHHPARFAVCEALFLAVVMVDEFGVVEPEEVQQRGVIVVRADRIHDGLVPELIGCAVGHAAFDPAAGEPTAEALAIVITPG